jgi:hypothetical protein
MQSRFNVMLITLLALVFAAPAFGVSLLGVVRTGAVETLVDTVILSVAAGKDTVPTPGFGGAPDMEDTFEFAQRELPTGVSILYVRGGTGYPPLDIPGLVQDSWYDFPSRQPTFAPAKIMFTVVGTGVEQAVEPLPAARLRAGASVFGGPVAMSAFLPNAGRAVVEVFDGTGRLIRTLASGTYAAGESRFVWDRCDARAREVGAGIYFARLTVGSSRSLARLVLVE